MVDVAFADFFTTYIGSFTTYNPDGSWNVHGTAGIIDEERLRMYVVNYQPKEFTAPF
jgi:hypothetical protein